MTHLPYILSSYALGVLVPLGFGIAAMLRMRAATRRLTAVDPRQRPMARQSARQSARQTP